MQLYGHILKKNLLEEMNKYTGDLDSEFSIIFPIFISAVLYLCYN